MLSALSGLRKNDGSIVEGPYAPAGTNNQSFIRRPSINSLGAPPFRQEGDMGRYIAFNDPGQPGAGFSNYQDYLDAGNPAVMGPMVGPIGTKGAALGPNNPVMLPGGGSISQGEYNSLPSNPNYTTAVDPSTISSSQPLPGLTGITGMLDGPNNPMVKIGGGSISQGEYFANYGGSNVGPNINTTPITNTGIGSLTQNPINTTPESSITGSIGSPYLNNNQDLDQYLNSYVENLINRRMRDIFGGIMSIFQ